MHTTPESHHSHAIGGTDDPLPRLRTEAGDRDAKGRFAPGNQVNLVVGHRSLAFWTAQAASRAEIEADLLSDMGHDPIAAPRAARLAAEAIAQAVLITRSAFERIGEAAGPLSVRGNGRRAYLTWLQAYDRLERGLRLVGLERRAKPVIDLAQAFAQDRDRG